MSDMIYLDKLPSGFFPSVKASDPRFVKHVHCEGARFHVLSWNHEGSCCSEPV